MVETISIPLIYMLPSINIGCQPKNRGKNPKMDKLYNGKPYEQMDDLGGKNHYFWKHPNLAKTLETPNPLRLGLPSARSFLSVGDLGGETKKTTREGIFFPKNEGSFFDEKSPIRFFFSVDIIHEEQT